MAFLQLTYFSNTLQTWVIAAVVAMVVMAGLRILQRFLVRRFSALAEETENDVDDLIVRLLTKTRFSFLLVVSFYVGSLVLTLSERMANIVSTVVIMALLIQAAIWGDKVISFWLNRYQKWHLEEDAASVTTINALSFVARLALFTLVVLLALDNLGVDVTALIASLGIGGVAVALAVQNILADLFASLSIALDKPFVIGDFIIVGDYLGTVEQVGLKTTRVRSLSGEQLVFSNNDLLSSRIRNYKRMHERRAVFSFGVTYETPYETLTAIPAMVQEIVEAQEKTRFDRAHFKEYGDFSLNFEVVYHVLDSDYNLYMDVQQAINLAIFKRFGEEGIEFAYPTQTLYIADGRQEVPIGSDEEAVGANV